ncbi:transporter substrate-binding domain-containing protein [Mycolicibacterium setense]|uniref:ABC transporter substrate-binding protein n=1 Tax=Mycolicibacterium setense TaxID=431269 RepID=A0ABR4YSA8_9MYCO|nr:transporter substrate-binding domain-containing protein [Mycolicibacterium setense]KHO19239.1 ABC transporter substrate-binding protein [Mycolicibacterium setense]KHO23925.1 ABC transporter substrate-binding protein [Mycolicibacterium setense]MCV7113157.1 transporter substrate-binding domain-containing protein [Mycolicibacterium setense]
MRRALRVVFAALAAITALVLAGCTSSGQTGTSQSSVLNKVLTSKKITVGVFADAPPYGVMNSSGEYEGFDIDKARALADSLGARVEFVSATNASRIPMLETGKADVVIAALTNLDERAQVVALTRPYASEGQLVVVPADSPIRSYDDLTGRTVASTRGSVPATILEAEFPQAKPSLFEAVADSIQALRSGKVDALMESTAVVAGVRASQGDAVRVLDAPPLAPSFVSFGIKMGDQLWLNYLNNFVMNYNISKAASESYNKWLGMDVPALIK